MINSGGRVGFEGEKSWRATNLIRKKATYKQDLK